MINLLLTIWRAMLHPTKAIPDGRGFLTRASQTFDDKNELGTLCRKDPLHSSLVNYSLAYNSPIYPRFTSVSGSRLSLTNLLSMDADLSRKLRELPITNLYIQLMLMEWNIQIPCPLFCGKRSKTRNRKDMNNWCPYYLFVDK